LEQGDILLGEVSACVGADVQHAHDIAAHEHGYPDQRGQAFAAEDGADDVGLIDMINDDRFLLGRHGAGEARAHVDTNALRDFILKSDGGDGGQLVCVRVEQEEGGRIRVEQNAHPLKQFTEQCFRVEVRQGGVRDGKDAAQTVVTLHPVLVDHGRIVSQSVGGG
jgi:hypothetical protein